MATDNPELELKNSESLRRREYKVRLHVGNHYTICYAYRGVHHHRNWLTDAEYLGYDGKYQFKLPDGSTRRLHPGSIIDIFMLSGHQRTIEYREELLDRARTRRHQRLVAQEEATDNIRSMDQ